MKALVTASLAILGVLAGTQAQAASTTTINGSNGSSTASLTFNLLDSSTLLVTMTNTSVGGATSFDDVLTGFFFSQPSSAVTPVSVALATGSGIANCAACGGVSNVSGEYYFASGVYGLKGSQAANVVSAADFGFLTATVGNTPVLSANGGIDFGLVSNTTNFGQSMFTGSPLITQSINVTYTLGSGTFDLRSLSGGFLWGNTYLAPLGGTFSMTDVSAPEPATFLMMGLGLAGVIFLHRRRKRA